MTSGLEKHDMTTDHCWDEGLEEAVEGTWFLTL